MVLSSTEDIMIYVAMQMEHPRRGNGLAPARLETR